MMDTMPFKLIIVVRPMLFIEEQTGELMIHLYMLFKRICILLTCGIQLHDHGKCRFVLIKLI